MDWVTEDLAIGGLGDLVDHGRLQEAGVEAVLQLFGHVRERAPIPLPIEVLQLPVRDREPLPPELLREGLAFLHRQRAAGRRIVVACGAGISRSVCFAAALLHEEGMPLPKAFQIIGQARRQAAPHRRLIESLIDYYGVPEDESEALLLPGAGDRGSRGGG